MTLKLHYRTISSYRELPPKWKIVESEPYQKPVDYCLAKVDQTLQEARSRITYNGTDDLVSLVFANQALGHEIQSRQMAELVQERRALTQRHLRDVQWRLDELKDRKPLRPRGPGFVDDGKITDVEKQILELERQQRALEQALWRDTQELRTELTTQRHEQQATHRRMDFLTGGTYAGA